MSRLPIAILLFLLPQASSFAQTSTYVDSGGKQTVSWNDMVGKIVTVDGLAWGALAKGLGQHLVLPASRVYVHDVDYHQHDLNGRLLRVSGFLRKARERAVPAHIQGYGTSFDYYFIESIAVEKIDKIQHDQLLPSKFDWIVVGADTEAALRTMARLGHEDGEGMLSIVASEDGSKPHSYQISDDEILLFYDLNGRINSVGKFKLNGFGKADDEWTSLKGYKLQPKT